MATGISVSKDVSYVALSPPQGVSVAKDVAYVALCSIATGINVSKEVAYVALVEATAPVQQSSQPVICFLGL